MPDWAHVFVFGSALHSNAPKDLDLLVVYDPAGCPPNEAREKAELLASIIGQKSGLCPHVVVLSIKEEESISFIHSEGCVPFEEWFKNWSDAIRNPAPSIIDAAV